MWGKKDSFLNNSIQKWVWGKNHMFRKQPQHTPATQGHFTQIFPTFPNPIVDLDLHMKTYPGLTFIFPQRLTLVSNAKRKISKSNKSELWNRLSYFFEVGSQTFRNDYKILRSQPQNSTSIILWPQWPQKRPFLTFQK